MPKKIILASESPRRKDLLSLLGCKFEIIKPNIHENIHLKKPSYLVKNLALQKARKIKNLIQKKAVIIAADTIVFCKNEIIGKPQSHQDAKRILNKITRYPHFVYTGFVVMDLFTAKTYSDYEKTEVFMNKIPSNEINKIIEKHKDKAGCYAIQTNDNLVKKINGDFYNVVGFPIKKISLILKDCGIKISDKKLEALYRGKLW